MNPFPPSTKRNKQPTSPWLCVTVSRSTLLLRITCFQIPFSTGSNTLRLQSFFGRNSQGIRFVITFHCWRMFTAPCTSIGQLNISQYLQIYWNGNKLINNKRKELSNNLFILTRLTFKKRSKQNFRICLIIDLLFQHRCEQWLLKLSWCGIKVSNLISSF